MMSLPEIQQSASGITVTLRLIMTSPRDQRSSVEVGDVESLHRARARTAEVTREKLSDPEVRKRIETKVHQLNNQSPSPTVTGDEFIEQANRYFYR